MMKMWNINFSFYPFHHRGLLRLIEARFIFLLLMWILAEMKWNIVYEGRLLLQIKPMYLTEFYFQKCDLITLQIKNGSNKIMLANRTSNNACWIWSNFGFDYKTSEGALWGLWWKVPIASRILGHSRQDISFWLFLVNKRLSSISSIKKNGIVNKACLQDGKERKERRGGRKGERQAGLQSMFILKRRKRQENERTWRQRSGLTAKRSHSGRGRVSWVIWAGGAKHCAWRSKKGKHTFLRASGKRLSPEKGRPRWIKKIKKGDSVF